MPALQDQDRREIWAEIQRELSEVNEPLALSKTALKAAVDALDKFLSDNAAAINNAIPQPARGALTTSQKARLLMKVITQRYVKGA